MATDRSIPDRDRNDAEPTPRLSEDSDSTAYDAVAHLVVGFRGGGSNETEESAVSSLNTAADLGRRLHARLHVVHVVDMADYPIDPDAADWEQQARQALVDERHTVETALGPSGVPWTFHAAHGEPANLLRTVADEFDALMFIVGSRGEGMSTVLSRLLEPSVTHSLIKRTHRPVLVVPPHASG